MIDARTKLLGQINAFQASQAIHVAATLGLADHLHRTPASVTTLANLTKTKPDALHRLMRALTAIGVITQAEGGKFQLTDTGEYLRRDVPGTCAPMAELIGRPNFWAAWGDLGHPIRTGTTAFKHVHGCDVWDYRRQNPHEASIFDRAMAAGTAYFAQAVLEVCDFGSFKHLVDVGGGDGMFLSKILNDYPALHGTLFDQPQVVKRALASQSFDDFNTRFRAIAGDFFECVPDGGDAYLLKWVLHDWGDAASIAILKSCGRAMRSGATLLVAECIINPGKVSVDAALMDLMMMVMAGGRERTKDEFESIFADAGFRLTSLTPTATPLSVIQGVLAN